MPGEGAIVHMCLLGLVDGGAVNDEGGGSFGMSFCLVLMRPGCGGICDVLEEVCEFEEAFVNLSEGL